MKKYYLITVISFFTSITFSFSQNSGVNTSYRIYQEAEKLYHGGKYQASLDLINTKAKDLSIINDSLLYLKIINLENIYQSDNKKTVLLEETILSFLKRVQKNIFPDNLYSEVVEIYVKLIRFQYIDNAFYKITKREIVPFNVYSIKVRNDSINNYILVNKNSYYLDSLNKLYLNNLNTISILETEIEKKKNDSITLHNLKKVGKLSTLALAYSFPGEPVQELVFDELKDISHFLNGNNDSISPLIPDLALGLSLVNICIDLYTNKRFKISIDWAIFDIKYHMFSIKNSIFKPKPYDVTYIERLNSFCVGTRIGLMVPVTVVNRISIAPYFNLSPAVCFLYKPIAFFVNTENSDGYSTGGYEIKPKTANFNLSYEFGLRIYFYENKYISAYIQNSSFNWSNTITRNNLTTESYTTQCEYKYQVLGLRIGF